MNVVRATQRLSRYEFREDRDTATNPPAIYTCPHCQRETELFMRDFAQNAYSTHTNLTVTDSAAIAQALPLRRSLANSFLDFYCGGCQSPVRLYYLADALAGPLRGRNGYIIKLVIEGSPASPPPLPRDDAPEVAP